MAESPVLVIPSGSEVEDRRSTRRSRITYAVVGVLAIAGLGWALRAWLYARGHEATDNAQVEGHFVPDIPKVGGFGASAGVRTAKARLAAAQPAAGRGSKKTVKVGQPVGPSQTLMSLVDERDVWVVANLKETQLDQVALDRRNPSAPVLRPGMSVEVAIDTRVQRGDTTMANAHALVDR